MVSTISPGPTVMATNRRRRGLPRCHRAASAATRQPHERGGSFPVCTLPTRARPLCGAAPLDRREPGMKEREGETTASEWSFPRGGAGAQPRLLTASRSEQRRPMRETVHTWPRPQTVCAALRRPAELDHGPCSTVGEGVRSHHGTCNTAGNASGAVTEPASAAGRLPGAMTAR